MEKVIKILTLKNQIEADILEKVLKKEKIPFNLKSFHDSVYDGLFELRQDGWGIIEAPSEFKKQILKLYNDSIIQPKHNNKDKKFNPKNTSKELKRILIVIFVLIVIIFILLSRFPLKKHSNFKRHVYHNTTYLNISQSNKI